MGEEPSHLMSETSGGAILAQNFRTVSARVSEGRRLAQVSRYCTRSFTPASTTAALEAGGDMGGGQTPSLPLGQQR